MNHKMNRLFLFSLLMAYSSPRDAEGFTAFSVRRIPTPCSTSSVSVSRDEYLQPHYTAPTPEKHFEVERMVECASADGLCDTDEMVEMIAEIERTNQEAIDSETQNRDEVLKQALELQLELSETRAAMNSLGLKTDDKHHDVQQVASGSGDSELENHSFDHFVDYRVMGEFESH